MRSIPSDAMPPIVLLCDRTRFFTTDCAFAFYSPGTHVVPERAQDENNVCVNAQRVSYPDLAYVPDPCGGFDLERLMEQRVCSDIPAALMLRTVSLGRNLYSPCSWLAHLARCFVRMAVNRYIHAVLVSTHLHVSSLSNPHAQRAG